MPVVRASTTKVAIIEELIPLVTPATPEFTLVRVTGESISFEPTTSESQEFGGNSRSQKPANVTGLTVAGDLSGVMAPAAWLDMAVEGVLAEDFGECPLTGAPGGGIDSVTRVTSGQDKKTYTIEKQFLNPGNVPGAVPMTAVAGAAGAQTADVTFATGPNVGSAVVAIEVESTAFAGVRTFEASILAADDDDAAAAALAAVVDADPDLTAAATLGVTTIDCGAGNTITTLTVVGIGADSFVYQWYRGSTFSTMVVGVTPNEDATVTFSVVGGEPDLGVLPIVGATYLPVGDSPVFTAPEVLDLTLGSMNVGTSCWTTLTITIDSQNTAIACIGSKGEREVVLGDITVSMEGEVYFSGSQALLQAVIDNRVIGDSVVTLSNADGDIFRFDIYGSKAVGATLTAESKDDNLAIPVTIEPTPRIVCDDGGSSWEAGLIISKENTSPPVP